MSGPKHLWSGDWEDESARAAARRSPGLLEPPEPEPPAPEPEVATPADRTPPIRYAGVIVALVLVVGVVLAATLAGSSKKHNRTGSSTIAATPPTGTGPNGGAGIQTNPPIQTTPIINLPSAEWLGMQIVTSSTGAVVSNVQLGSPGDADGFEPGDGINTIDGRQIGTVTQIRSATAKLPLGSQLRVQVERGSTPITLVLTMRKRPTISP
jgi:membrane-associated protease RseP (regulator of RpoE activity)